VGVALFGTTGCAGDRTRSGFTGTTIAPGVDPRTLAPAPRPVVRVGGAALGFPSPFAYIANPGYRQMCPGSRNLDTFRENRLGGDAVQVR